MDVSRAFEKSPEGYQALTWVLYIAAGAVACAQWIDISGTTLFIGTIAIIAISGMRKAEAASTIYGSHLNNIFTVMLGVLLVGALLWLIFIGTFGIGIIVTWPLSWVLIAWSLWRLIRGFIKLSDGVAYV
jgi:hypothetical protein